MAIDRHRRGPLTTPRGTVVSFDELPGYAADDLLGCVACLRQGAADRVPLRPARPASPALAGVLREAAALDGGPALRRFFASRFTPVRLTSVDAFFTGYYEPVVQGSLHRSAAFTAPLLARPADLRTLATGEPRPSWAEDLAAVRAGPDGAVDPYPDRAAIEAGIECGEYRPVVWLRDRVETFMVQVQGSARVTLEDGRRLRVTYAGRNGHPYTSVGRLLVEAGAIPAEAMSLDRLEAWLRRHGLDPGQQGYDLLMRNRSFVFFDAAADETPAAGPVGGSGVPLSASRSIAVDRSRWCYGLPFHVDVTIPGPGGAPQPFQQVCVAQDTGSAIVGEARVDLFMGSGEEAGRRAGAIRHRGALTVLWPKDA